MNKLSQLNAFDEGAYARKADVPLHDNPYDPHDYADERHEWAEGWRAMDWNLNQDRESRLEEQ